MPTTKEKLFVAAHRGFDRTLAPHLTEPRNYYDLENLQPWEGVLRQYPLLVKKFELTIPKNTIRLIRPIKIDGELKYLVVGSLNKTLVDLDFSAEVEIPSIVQISTTPQEADFDFCLLFNIDRLAVTNFFSEPEDFLEVIFTGTELDIRRKQGSYAIVPIDYELRIPGTNTKLAFLDYENIPPGTKWCWKRQQVPDVADYETAQLHTAIYQDDLYFSHTDDRVMRYRDGYVSSVGYAPIYGRHLEVFYNHLFVGKLPGQPYRIEWSDLNNPDQFHPQFMNEADGFTLSNENFADSTVRGCTGLGVLGNKLFIFTSNLIYGCEYVGLPTVMQIQPVAQNIGCAFDGGLVKGKRGLYFLSRDQFYYTDGTSFEEIGFPVREKFFGELIRADDEAHNRLFGYYNSFYGEVCWAHYYQRNGVRQQRLVVYNEKTNSWTWRTLPSVWSKETSEVIHCQTAVFDESFTNLYGNEHFILKEHQTEEFQGLHSVLEHIIIGSTVDIVEDMTFIIPKGETFHIPAVTNKHKLYLETVDYTSDDIYKTKSTDTFVLNANWTFADSVKVYVSRRDYTTAPVEWQFVGSWKPTAKFFRLSKPSNDPFRVLRFKFEIEPNYEQLDFLKDFVLKVWGTRVLEDDDLET